MAGIVTGVRGRNSGGRSGRVVGTRGRAAGVNSWPVTIPPGDLVEPFTVVGLFAETAGSPTGWVWVQETGPTVVLTGVDGNRQYTAPGSMAGTSVRVRVTATFPGGFTSYTTVTHTMYAHGGPWMYRGGALVPVGVNPAGV